MTGETIVTGLLRGRRTRLTRMGLTMALIATLLGACAPQPHRPDPALDQAIIDAERSQDPIRLAAALWRKAAAQPAPQSSDLQLGAIEVLIDANKPQNAQAYLKDAQARRADWLRLEPRRARIVQGYEALQQGRTAESIRILQDIPAPLAPPEAARRLELLAQALDADKRPLDAARQRIALDTLVPQSLRQANQEAILRLLGGMGKAAFDKALIDIMEPELADWLQLVKADHDGGDKLAQWRQGHPGHPLLPVILERLQREAAARAPRITPHVALLLSQDARLAEAAHAISAGVMLAQMQAGEAALPVREYPGATDREAFRRNYEEAIAQGATSVIGPLDRETLQSLVGFRSAVPMIALNTLENGGGTQGNMVQFGLPPEDEAEAVADRLIAQGSLRVLALTPSDSLGERTLKAFTARYQAAGGRIVESMRYGNQPGGWDAQARQLLQPHPDPIDGSPRMREDADALFLVARSRDAQQWVPLLRAQGGGNLPILATSHVYDGAPKPASDRDKDGLYFCDMPLILAYARRPGQEQPGRFEQAALTGQPRLFALGYDAYVLATRFDDLRHKGALRGQTGLLKLDAGNRIRRLPGWALFRGGLANPLDVIQP